jgi:CheY-like chemotaxis protein
MKTILVVDDEPTIRMLVAASLDGGAYRLLEAGDGYEALDLVRMEQPDLVLLDIAIPGLDGFEVCRRLKTELSPDVPVLLLTGFAQQTHRERAHEVGADGFVAKPFSPAALVTLIDRTLATEPVTSP